MNQTASRFGAFVAVLTLALLTVAASMGTTPARAGLPDDPSGDLHSLEHVRASGAVHSPDGILEKGCQSHGYRYRVQPAGSDWSLELFLVDPDGEQVANGYEWKGRDPARGRGHFELCSQPTRAGTFTVRARLTWDDGEYHEKWLKPRTIQLHR